MILHTFYRKGSASPRKSSPSNSFPFKEGWGDGIWILGKARMHRCQPAVWTGLLFISLQLTLLNTESLSQQVDSVKGRSPRGSHPDSVAVSPTGYLVPQPPRLLSATTVDTTG